MFTAYLMKSYRSYISVLLAMLFTFGVSAETVERKEAARIAAMFFNEANHRVNAAPQLAYTGRRLTTGMLFNPFYVFNSPAGGFVIVSAENKAFPILGYSLSGSFDTDKIGKTEKALLRSYARDIELIRHDSDVPYEAILAWQNIPEHISSILSARDLDYPVNMTLDDADDLIGNIFAAEREADMSSDMFTPAQWNDEIGQRLRKTGSVAIGIADRNDIRPIVAHGRKGDYWHLELDGSNDMLMRLLATEILSYGQIADLGDSFPPRTFDEEEEPFAFHEETEHTRVAEEREKERMFEERLYPSVPYVTGIGGGRFRITFPQEIIMSRVYNLDGRMVRMNTYDGINAATINLEGNPPGFYFVVVNGADGKPFGFKLYR